MSSRLGLRLLNRQLPQLRQHIGRRFESTTPARVPNPKLPEIGDPLVGAADNAFNRERAAVRAHAAATSGK
jgi:hypothetical protein